VFVELGVILVGEFMIMGGIVLVSSGVFVGSDVTGMLVSNAAPGVKKTLIHAGCVRMEGSRGSRKSLGRLVRKSLFGSMLDPMSVSNLQVGAKRIAHPPARIIQRKPTRRITRMMTQSRLSFSGAFSCPIISIYDHGQVGE
jgi:hypothetical protein